MNAWECVSPTIRIQGRNGKAYRRGVQSSSDGDEVQYAELTGGPAPPEADGGGRGRTRRAETYNTLITVS